MNTSLCDTYYYAAKRGYCSGTVVFDANSENWEVPLPLCNGDYKVWFINGDGDPSYYTEVLASEVFTVTGSTCDPTSIEVQSSDYNANEEIGVELHA
mmetsp:Transcript_29886/g.34430  ORF Transcript_29886/g.34430 Transcript_29886/m.34430 type:complete len:97 (+) Transcript_29886:1816-2106(+)